VVAVLCLLVFRQPVLLALLDGAVIVNGITLVPLPRQALRTGFRGLVVALGLLRHQALRAGFRGLVVALGLLLLAPREGGSDLGGHLGGFEV
jgi:hypothetical protein